MSLAIPLVLTSGFFHALWNFYTKKSLNKVAFLFAVQVIAFAIYAPICLSRLLDALVSDQWPIFAASIVIHGIYFIMLAKLYEIGDLSQVYPIIRGTSLLIIPIFGILAFDESLSALGCVGILMIIGGIFFISEIKLAQLNFDILLLSLGVGSSIALYIVIDRLAMNHTDPVTLNQIGSLGNILGLLPLVLRDSFRSLAQESRKNSQAIFMSAALAPLSYILFLFAISLAPISTMAPIREFGVVCGALIGVFLLKEPHGKSRIIASIVITMGIILLSL